MYPREHRISDEVDIDMPKQHRRAVMGFEPHARHAVLDHECHRHRRTCPEFLMLPAGGERIEREALPEIHYRHDRPAIGFQHFALLAEKVPADQAGGSDERDACNQEVSCSEGHRCLQTGPTAACTAPPNHRSVAQRGRSAGSDLSTEIGIPGRYTHERVRAAFETVARAAKGHGKAMGVGGVRQDFEFQSWLLRLGVRYLTGGSDVGYILSAGRADVKQLRELKL
jgi:hypothetical protein